LLGLKDGLSKTPLCIHRAPLGTHERFIGFLIEHFGGNFPLWLAPKQVVLLPVSDKFNEYAQNITNKLKLHGIRASLDNRSEKIGSKIRDAEMQKINIMIIVGEKEVENQTLTIRRRFVKEQKELSFEEFSKEILSEIRERRVSN
jgi:threonyl-tRNA synthetase